MNLRRTKLCFLSILFFNVAMAQDIATLEVSVPEGQQGLIIPVNTNLDLITNQPDSTISLYFKSGNGLMPIAFQVAFEGSRQMHWIVEPGQITNGKAVYILSNKTTSKEFPAVISVDDGSKLTIQAGDKKLLSYQHATVYPPAGVDSSFQRSAFIHPLYAPNGQVLTRIQPPDHYHHYGIWNPQTHVLFRGDTLDFWNLGKKQATVRFGGFTNINDGPVFSSYSALHESVKLSGGDNEVVFNELQSVRIYQPESDGQNNYYILDMTIEMNCATDDPVTLLEYRYAGFGWRTTEKWDKNNSMVLSSTGKDRVGVDGSKERWAIVQGEIDDDYAGAVLMSHPTNYNHPEPMRVWPINMYDRGDMFASFTTTKDTDWVLHPKKTYVLRYRMIVYNDRFTKERAENGWQNFAALPSIKVIKN